MRKESAFYLILSLVIFFQSCASFDKELINPNPLNKENLSVLNGQYDIIPFKIDTISNDYKNQYWIYNNFLTEIDRKLLKDTLKIDSQKSYSFDLKVLNPNRIKINYLENGKVFRERVLKTELKKDGYLYLKNKNVGFLLVPYIAGAIDIKKTRITKSENGNLIFDVANHRSGSFLIIVFLNGKTWKYRQEYKKIE